VERIFYVLAAKVVMSLETFSTMAAMKASMECGSCLGGMLRTNQ